MTTYYAFAPGNTAPPFQFQPTLDGNVYNATVGWNLSGKRWYLTLTDLNNNLVFCQPLIASPPDYDINLAFGYFQTSTLIFREASQNFEVSP